MMINIGAIKARSISTDLGETQAQQYIYISNNYKNEGPNHSYFTTHL